VEMYRKCRVVVVGLPRRRATRHAHSRNGQRIQALAVRQSANRSPFCVYGRVTGVVRPRDRAVRLRGNLWFTAANDRVGRIPRGKTTRSSSRAAGRLPRARPDSSGRTRALLVTARGGGSEASHRREITTSSVVGRMGTSPWVLRGVRAARWYRPATRSAVSPRPAARHLRRHPSPGLCPSHSTVVRGENLVVQPNIDAGSGASRPSAEQYTTTLLRHRADVLLSRATSLPERRQPLVTSPAATASAASRPKAGSTRSTRTQPELKKHSRLTWV